MASDLRVDRAQHPRMCLHQPDASYRQAADERGEQDARFDESLTLLVTSQPVPDEDHRATTSLRVTNTAAPEASPRPCTATEIVDPPFVNVSMPSPAPPDTSEYRSAWSDER
jgi:hypothetical protein